MPNARKPRPVRRPGTTAGPPQQAPKPPKSSNDALHAAASALARIESKIDKCATKSAVDTSPASLLGRAAGTVLGQGDLGAAAGSAIGKYFGFGDYEVRTNSLIKGTMKSSKSSQIPTFNADGRRGIRVTEREYIGDITSSSSSGAFKVDKFRINPADPVTFPWLSTLAAQFDEWEPHGIVFEYVSTSAEFNGTNQSLGTIITATDYDPVDPTPTSKLVMEQYDYSSSSRPSNSLLHGVECDMKERQLRSFYTAASAPSTDLRLHDLGNFFIGSYGVSGTSVSLGELWVSYDVTFYKKQLTAGQLGGTILEYVAVTNAGGTNSNPFAIGTANRFSAGSLQVTFADQGSGVWRCFLPPNIATGYYLVMFTLNAITSVTLSTNPITPNANCSLTSIWPNGGSSGGKFGSGSSTCTAYYGLQINGPNASFDMQAVTFVGGVGAGYFRIQQKPANTPTGIYDA